MAHREGEETFYYGTVHLGSTVSMTDEDGVEVWSGAVTPFADQESTEGLAEHVLFTGKELDEDTGLYYFNARWYDGELGRFISEDPARDGLNWYVYVNNNPLGFVDPSGMELTLASGAELSFHFPYGSPYDGEPNKNENGLVQWEHNGTYVLQDTFWSKSMIGQLFGAKPKKLGILENPTLEEKKDLGLDPLGLTPILKDLDGNFLKTFHDAVKDDNSREVLFSAGMFASDLLGDAALLFSVGEATIEGGAKLGLSTLFEGSFKTDDFKNLMGESFSTGVISSLPIIGTVKSGQNLLDALDNNGISDRDAFTEIRNNRGE